MRVLQSGENLDLDQEPSHPDRVRDGLAQHLDRNLSVVFEVLREKDRGHTSLTELSLDSVTVADRCRERSGQVLRRAGRWWTIRCAAHCRPGLLPAWGMS